MWTSSQNALSEKVCHSEDGSWGDSDSDSNSDRNYHCNCDPNCD